MLEVRLARIFILLFCAIFPIALMNLRNFNPECSVLGYRPSSIMFRWAAQLWHGIARSLFLGHCMFLTCNCAPSSCGKEWPRRKEGQLENHLFSAQPSHSTCSLHSGE